MKLNKKAQQQITFTTAPNLIIILVLIGLIAAAGAVAIQSLRDTSSNTGTSSFLDSNSFTALNSTAVLFGDGDSISCTLSSFFNGTNFVNITDEFTLTTQNSRVNCYATLVNNTYNDTAITANYTKTVTTFSSTYNISQQGLNSITNFSIQLPTVGTMIGVGLILAVVIGVFAFFARRKV